LLNIEIQVDPFSEVEEVEKKLDGQAKDYHLFVSDLIQETKTGKSNMGEYLIAQARRNNAEMGIVAFTQGGVEDREGALAAGADNVFFKSMLLKPLGNENLKKFGKILKEAVEKRQKKLLTRPIDFVFDKYDIRLNAVIQTIGPDNIKALVADMKPTTATPDQSGREGSHNRLLKAEAFFLRSGLSGATVLRLLCHYEVPEGSPEDKRGILLKVSRDHGSLKDELAKRRDATNYFGELFPSFFGYESIAIANDWYGIGAKFLDDANTFLDWIFLLATTPDKIKQTMKVLFGEGGLQNVYRNTSHKEILPHQAISNIMSDSQRARIVMAVDELTPIIDKKIADGLIDKDLYDKKMIDGFLFEKPRVGDIGDEQISSMPRYQNTLYCRNHGDLHCGNILVNQNDQPRLIDPANIKEQPWMADIARFCADLIGSGLDSGASSYEWERIGSWINACTAFIEGSSVDVEAFGGKGNDRVITALNWIRNELPEIQPHYKTEAQEWQFRLGLAVEFLRAGYRRESLTGPKRTLGLIAACIALRSSCEAFKRIYSQEHPVTG